MKPAAFNYLRPTDLTEALEYLKLYGEDAKVISGGQSLVPLLNMRLATPYYLIDISRLEELKYIRKDHGFIRMGALTRHVEVENSPMIKTDCPLLTEAVSYIGHSQIRNRGTIGGSIAHGDPSAELPVVLSALRGEIVIIGLDGERMVSPDEFFLTYMLTNLDPIEIVKEVRFPVLPIRSGFAFVEKARRHGDFALVEAAAVIALDEKGCISDARLAIGGVHPVPVVLTEIEEKLMGQKPTNALFEHVSQLVKDLVDPEEDLHATVDYRRQLASVLTKRALILANNRLNEGGIKVG